jgi:Ca2+-binding EF-hand superfamily protein
MTTAVRDAMSVKLANVFNAFDRNRDGQIEAEDFDAIVKDVTREFKLPSDSVKGRALANAYMVLWDELLRHADTDRDRKISQAEFIENGMKAIDDRSRVNVVDHLGNAIFEVTDTDEDNTVSKAEFARLQRAFRVPERDTGQAFAGLDTDGDGSISREEFLAGVRDYFTSPNFDGPGSWFYGRPS